MSDFYYSDVGLLLLECGIFATRMSDFYYSAVGFLLLGCRIFATRMSDFYNTNGTYKIRRLHYYASRALSCMVIYVIFGLSWLIDPLQKWLTI